MHIWPSPHLLYGRSLSTFSVWWPSQYFVTCTHYEATHCLIFISPHVNSVYLVLGHDPEFYSEGSLFESLLERQLPWRISWFFSVSSDKFQGSPSSGTPLFHCVLFFPIQHSPVVWFHTVRVPDNFVTWITSYVVCGAELITSYMVRNTDKFLHVLRCWDLLTMSQFLLGPRYR